MTHDTILVPLPDGRVVELDRDTFLDMHDTLATELRARGFRGDELDREIEEGLRGRVWLAVFDRGTMH